LCEDDGDVKADYCPEYIVNLLVFFGIAIIALSVMYMLVMIIARDKIK